VRPVRCARKRVRPVPSCDSWRLPSCCDVAGPQRALPAAECPRRSVFSAISLRTCETIKKTARWQ
jgi:hypothetical protein